MYVSVSPGAPTFVPRGMAGVSIGVPLVIKRPGRALGDVPGVYIPGPNVVYPSLAAYNAALQLLADNPRASYFASGAIWNSPVALEEAKLKPICRKITGSAECQPIMPSPNWNFTDNAVVVSNPLPGDVVSGQLPNPQYQLQPLPPGAPGVLPLNQGVTPPSLVSSAVSSASSFLTQPLNLVGTSFPMWAWLAVGGAAVFFLGGRRK